MSEPSISSALRGRREAAGLSQQALGEATGVSRQALIAIEAGRQVPSTALALRLARALGCSVEDLFQLSPAAALEAELVASGGPARGTSAGRVVLGHVNGRWVAHPLADHGFGAADAVAIGRGGGRVRVEPLLERSQLEHNVLVAGCAPLLGLLAHRAPLHHRELRVSWLHANTRDALAMLAAGSVHVAGLHGADVPGGDDHVALLRARFDRPMRIVNLTRWRQGLVVAPDNPLGIAGVADLLRPEVRFARREPGASAQQLAERLLGEDAAVCGPDASGPLARSHAQVAQLVACGAADAGVAIEAVALSAGLGFVPLSEERFDLALSAEAADHAPVARLLDLLAARVFRREAEQLAGYDSSLLGQETAVEAA